MKSKHTKGEVKLSKRIRSHKTLSGEGWGNFAKVYVRTGGVKDEEGIANANLICDAFNVTNETGMTPRELQKSHQELLEALIDLVKIKDECINYADHACDAGDDVAFPFTEAEQAITNATKK